MQRIWPACLLLVACGSGGSLKDAAPGPGPDAARDGAAPKGDGGGTPADSGGARDGSPADGVSRDGASAVDSAVPAGNPLVFVGGYDPQIRVYQLDMATGA